MLRVFSICTHTHMCVGSRSEGTLLMGLFLMSRGEESDPSKVNISICSATHTAPNSPSEFTQSCNAGV